MEALGFISLWGFTPSINFYKGTPLSLGTDVEQNILISECADLRHLLTTLGESLPLEQARKSPLNIYIHEKHKENLCRDLLLLTLICERQLSLRERQEIFLDIYSNCMIRDKTSAYVEQTVKELIQLVTEDERTQSPLKGIINFDNLRFKDRDDMEEIFSSYYKKHPFDMEKLRDQRLRHHFADRYDFRSNAVDWDYNFSMRDLAPHVHQREYKDWRLNGIAFETRLTTNMTPNRTMSSFVPGKKKKGGDSILVRGFWGDIINSPYIPFGIEILNDEDREKFFRKLNFQRIYMASDVSCYNVNKCIYKLENLQEYQFPFERLKHVEQQYKDDGADTKTEEGKEQLEEIKEEQEEEKEEVEENQKQEEEKEEEQEQTSIQDQAKDLMTKLTKPAKTLDLGKIDEDQQSEVSTQASETMRRQLLDGFQQANIKIHFLSGNIEKLYLKKKFHRLFDIGILSINSDNQIKDDMSVLFKDCAKVHAETADYMIIFKPEQRQEFRKKVIEKVQEAKWKVLDPSPYTHHLLLETKST